MAINYDSGGFIIGERRLKEMSEGITKTEDNTAQILKIISDGQLALEQNIKALVSTNKAGLDRQNRDAKSVSATEQSQAIKKTVEAASDLASVSRDALRQAREVDLNERRKVRSADSGGGVSSVSERTQRERERDSNGRFTSGNGNNESRGLFSWIKSLKGSVDSANVDVGGVDPTIDALREVKDVVSPVGRVFGGMGARAIGVFRGRMKKRAADEQLPQEQIKANKEQQRSDKQRNSLLRRLIDAVRSGGKGGGIGDALGGLFGGLGKRGGGLFKKGGKLLLKRLPFLGALVGGAFLAKDWKGLDTKGKGKGLGQIIGTAIGGALGAFGGPAGAVAGGALGNWLGGIFGEKVGGWVDQLKGEDWTGIFKNAVSGLADIAKKTFIPYRLGEAVGNGAANLWDKAKSFGSRVFGGGDIGAATGDFAPLLDVIAEGEAKGGAFGTSGYDAIYGGAKIKPSKPISQMTVAEVKAYQQQLVDSGHESTAVGRYQFIRNKGAFGKMAEQAGLKDTDIFDAKAQDKLAIHYLGGEKQLNEWIRTGNNKAITNKAAQQFASMKNTSGRGNYDGDGLNTARHGGLGVITDVTAEIRKNRETGATVKKESVKAPDVIKATNPAAKTQQAQIFKPGASRPAPIKVPVISPELTKIGQHSTAFAASKAPSDSAVGQTVSDRSIAHVLSGGLGYDQHSA